MKQVTLNIRIVKEENGHYSLVCLPEDINDDHYRGYGGGYDAYEVFYNFMKSIAEDKNIRYWSLLR